MTDRSRGKCNQICGCFLGIGFLLMSQVHSVWQLYLFYGVIIGIGVSGIRVPLHSSVARWLIKRLNQVTCIVIAGTGIGGSINPPIPVPAMTTPVIRLLRLTNHLATLDRRGTQMPLTPMLIMTP